MEWISDWIRQIILILFIATFIDLLLPSSSLDRYVKLVMGLIIIMAILQPILKLVLSEDRWTKFTASFPSTVAMPTIASLEEIQAKGKQLSQMEQTEIKQQFQTSMVNWSKKQVSRKFHVEVVSAEVTVGFEERQTPVIKHITVIATKQANEAAPQPIEPVQEVDVGVEPAESVPSHHDAKLETEIRQYIENTWELEDGQVVVQVNSP